MKKIIKICANLILSIFLSIFVIFLFTCCKYVKEKKNNYKDIKQDTLSRDSVFISKVKWIKLNDYVKYYRLSDDNSKNKNSVMFTLQKLGSFLNIDTAHRFTPCKDDSVINFSFMELSLFINDSTFFKTQKKGEYLFCISSDIIYSFKPWLLYRILIRPIDKKMSTLRSIKKEILKLEFVEKVTIDTIKNSLSEKMDGNLNPDKYYLKAILRNKKVTMNESKQYANEISKIKGVASANFVDIFTGIYGEESVYKLKYK